MAKAQERRDHDRVARLSREHAEVADALATATNTATVLGIDAGAEVVRRIEADAAYKSELQAMANKLAADLEPFAAALSTQEAAAREGARLIAVPRASDVIEAVAWLREASRRGLIETKVLPRAIRERMEGR
jgi:hypothetical protein